MAGEDLSSSELAPPPRPPLGDAEFAAAQRGLEDDLQRATAAQGMTRWFWGEGVCLLASLRLADVRGERTPPWIDEYLARHAARPPVLEHVNNLAPAATVAAVHARDPRPEYERLIGTCLDWYASSPAATREPGGALEHWPGGVWADTVYMAGQFLLRAGVTLGRDDLVDEAVAQWLRHAELLQDDRTGLIAHGTHMGVRIPCHWGRANAWFALAGADLAAVTGHPEVAERLALHLDAVAALQPAHGVWDVLIDSPPEARGILETSAAAGLGAALLRAAALRPGEAARWREAGERAVRGMSAYIEEGLLTRVSAGTVLQLIPFGYSVIRDDRPQPWGQGLALEAMAAWRETHPV